MDGLGNQIRPDVTPNAQGILEVFPFSPSNLSQHVPDDIYITMRSSRILSLFTLTTLSTSFLIPSTFLPLADSLPEPLRSLLEQSPMDGNLGPIQPPAANKPSAPSAPADNSGDGSDLTISDILPKTRSINIFASLTRDISSIANRLSSTTPGTGNTTLLAPLNSVMQGLPRKPWEDNPNAAKAGAESAARNEDTAAENLRRFVEHHAVPVSPWKEGEKVESLGGKEIWWERRGEKKVLRPDDVEVEGVAGKTGNGEVWVVKGVINY
jgi:hypothetical protein